MEIIRINEEDYEISFSAKNEKVYEMESEEFMEKVLNGYDVDFINISDKSSKINTELLSFFLGARTEGTYENSQNNLIIKMQKYSDDIKIESIKYGDAFYAEETEYETVDWSSVLLDDASFLNDKLIKDYKKLKKILEIAGYESQINIDADKIEIIGKEDTVIITPDYKIWKCCNSVKTFILKKFDTETNLESKIELPFDEKFRIAVAETGTYLDYDCGIWEYREVVLFDLEKNIAFLDKMENLSETKMTELEKLINTISGNVQEEDVKKLKKFLNIFKVKWEENSMRKEEKK